MMTIIYCVISFVLGVVFHKAAAAWWAKMQPKLEAEGEKLKDEIVKKIQD
jgi:hypothetical protein